MDRSKLEENFTVLGKFQYEIATRGRRIERLAWCILALNVLIGLRVMGHI